MWRWNFERYIDTQLEIEGDKDNGWKRTFKYIVFLPVHKEPSSL